MNNLGWLWTLENVLFFFSFESKYFLPVQGWDFVLNKEICDRAILSNCRDSLWPQFEQQISSQSLSPSLPLLFFYCFDPLCPLFSPLSPLLFLFWREVTQSSPGQAGLPRYQSECVCKPHDVIITPEQGPARLSSTQWGWRFNVEDTVGICHC